jgi:hypothetical protein
MIHATVHRPDGNLERGPIDKVGFPNCMGTTTLTSDIVLPNTESVVARGRGALFGLHAWRTFFFIMPPACGCSSSGKLVYDKCGNGLLDGGGTGLHAQRNAQTVSLRIPLDVATPEMACIIIMHQSLMTVASVSDFLNCGTPFVDSGSGHGHLG